MSGSRSSSCRRTPPARSRSVTRNAAIGDAIARLLAFAGHDVEREYYFNDAGGQMDRFGSSVEARYLQLVGREAEVPEDGSTART